MRSIALLPLFALVFAPVATPAIDDAPLCWLEGPAQDEPKKEEPKKEEPKQDGEKQEPKEETLELEITVGKRPASADMPMQPDAKFKLKEPLELEGKAAESEALRSALEKGIKYILDTQLEDGTWKFEAKTQIREEVPKNERYFSMTAGDSMNKVVLTSLCCMALRSHEPLAPEKVREAVAKGLEYVIENSRKHEKKTYGVWTWSFSIEFLVSEYNRTKDAELKERIREAVAATVEKLLMNQRAGQVKAPPVLPAMKEAKEEKKEEKSEKGFFGITPNAQDDPEQPGVLVMQVQRNGPASKGGIKANDRILEINGVRITGAEHLYQAVAELVPGETAKVKVLRGAPKTPRRTGAAAREDGGWSYYTWSESAGNCTASAILALHAAKSIGVDIPAAAMDRSLGYLSAMKLLREGTEEVGFRYTMQDRAQALDVRATVARVPACTLALNRWGKAEQKELEAALDIFMRRRGELDKVLGYPGNHVPNSFFNSAYYYYWSHYYVARAIKLVPDARQRAKMATTIQEVLLKNQKDGTWTDHEAWGRVYGTAMAMMTLGELRWAAEPAYAKPLPSLKVRAEY